MRILHVAEAYGGGVRSAIDDYVRNSPSNSHSLLFAVRSDAPFDQEELGGFETARPLPAGHFRRVRAVRDAVRSLRPDVVHAHSSFGGVYTRLAVAKKPGLRLVYTPHCYAFERLDSGPAMRGFFRLAEHLLAFNTSAFAACSPREARLSNWRGVTATVSMLPNVADVPSPDHAQAAAPQENRVPHLVGAGRDSEQKDPDFFAAAVNQLTREGLPFRATWIGGGPSLARRFARLPIEVTGWVERSEAVRIVASADVYLHTARWEGFPVAVLEAAALDVPTVVRDIKAFEGLSMPATVETPQDFVAHWRELGAQPGRRHHLNALHHALSSFNDAVQAQRLADLYGE